MNVKKFRIAAAVLDSRGPVDVTDVTTDAFNWLFKTGLMYRMGLMSQTQIRNARQEMLYGIHGFIPPRFL